MYNKAFYHNHVLVYYLEIFFSILMKILYYLYLKYNQQLFRDYMLPLMYIHLHNSDAEWALPRHNYCILHIYL